MASHSSNLWQRWFDVKELKINTSSREELKDITSKVKRSVSDIGLEDGICVLYVPHTTAGITINESADPDVATDIVSQLEEIAPRDKGYRHREGNADAHIKSSLIGNTTRIFIENGSLQLGTWQGIFFAEFDGPRSRTVWIKTS
ncbi:secondary thiamine-phosphate synthase enzyme YjbQ [Candidatus Bipolaricaulota bacterium]|nr:secondary thiamine-phosphate synthase enzyme YjbQ [Candidatus Bipolaricaulota bacterium]